MSSVVVWSYSGCGVFLSQCDTEEEFLQRLPKVTLGAEILVIVKFKLQSFPVALQCLPLFSLCLVDELQDPEGCSAAPD